VGLNHVLHRDHGVGANPIEQGISLFYNVHSNLKQRADW
jgi:hypothetical protein